MNDELREVLAKHLVGRHEQSDHGPTNRQPNKADRGLPHRRVDHRTKEEKERNKAKARRYARTTRDVTGMGLAPLAAMTIGGMAQGMEADEAFQRASKPYKDIAGATGRGAKQAGKKVAEGVKNIKPRNLRRFGKAEMLPVEQRIAKRMMRPAPAPQPVAKAQPVKDDAEFYAEFSKFDDDKKQVFGWASIVSKDGKTVVDRQMDTITPDDLETAAYSYVLKSRDGGEMHKRRGVATLVESFVVTPEKVSKLGLPEDSLPTGWWVGFQIKDDEVWDKVKKGHYTGFSIHGMGKRTKMDVDELFAQ